VLPAALVNQLMTRPLTDQDYELLLQLDSYVPLFRLCGHYSINVKNICVSCNSLARYRLKGAARVAMEEKSSFTVRKQNKSQMNSATS